MLKLEAAGPILSPTRGIYVKALRKLEVVGAAWRDASNTLVYLKIRLSFVLTKVSLIPQIRGFSDMGAIPGQCAGNRKFIVT